MYSTFIECVVQMKHIRVATIYDLIHTNLFLTDSNLNNLSTHNKYNAMNDGD